MQLLWHQKWTNNILVLLLPDLKLVTRWSQMTDYTARRKTFVWIKSTYILAHSSLSCMMVALADAGALCEYWLISVIRSGRAAGYRSDIDWTSFSTTGIEWLSVQGNCDTRYVIHSLAITWNNMGRNQVVRFSFGDCTFVMTCNG